MSGPPYIGAGAPITVHATASDLPAPTAFDGGVALEPLKSGRAIAGVPDGPKTVRALPASLILRIVSDGPGPVTIPGPVDVLAGSEGQYKIVGQLDGGALTVVVADQSGRDFPIFPGGDWERLRIVSAGALIGGTVTITLIPEYEV